MATGTLPFPGATVEAVARRIEAAKRTSVIELRPDIPAEFEAIVERLLQKNPADRYASARQVALALRAISVPSADDTPTATDVQFRPPRPPSRRVWVWGGGAAALVGTGWASAGTLRRWISGFGLPERKHIAVLPFRSIGGDTGQLAFCDGVTETLTTALAKHGGCSVIPTTDVRKIQSAADARREFGVNLVIASSMQRRGEQIRVIITLIDAVGLRQIDSETFDWPVNKIYEIEDSIISKISDLLNVSALEPGNPFVAGASQMPSAYLNIPATDWEERSGNGDSSGTLTV
jgi:TolB-like protein